MKISELKEPYRSMALANQKLQGNEPDESKDLWLNNRDEGGFTWLDTPECIIQRDFWTMVEHGNYPKLTTAIKANYPDIFPVENTNVLVEPQSLTKGEQLASAWPEYFSEGKDVKEESQLVKLLEWIEEGWMLNGGKWINIGVPVEEQVELTRKELVQRFLITTSK